MEVLYHCAKLGGNRTTHVCVRRQWVMFFTLYVFVCHGLRQPISGASDVHALLQQSVFVGRFICDLHSFFFGDETFFQWVEQVWKPPLGGAAIGEQMPEKIKIWENGCTVCAHHFGHLEARWKKCSSTAFYSMYGIVDVHPYIKIFCYLVT